LAQIHPVVFKKNAKKRTFNSEILRHRAKAVYPLWWPSLTKDMQTEQLLCWIGMADTEHSTTSSLNEKDEPKSRLF